MSALGQKRTCAAQNGMSALPPTATAEADISVSHVRLVRGAELISATRSQFSFRSHSRRIRRVDFPIGVYRNAIALPCGAFAHFLVPYIACNSFGRAQKWVSVSATACLMVRQQLPSRHHHRDLARYGASRIAFPKPIA